MRADSGRDQMDGLIGAFCKAVTPWRNGHDADALSVTAKDAL